MIRTDCEPLVLSCGTFRELAGSVMWRVWAPHCERLELILYDESERLSFEMEPLLGGYFEHREVDVGVGQRYAYRLPHGGVRPDPASRWQPEGVHRSSALYFPEDFAWHDDAWRGVSLDELAIYELHVGTFTHEGTFDGVAGRLAALVELGVTAIEIMPVAEFPGERNWGYDGVHPYAVQHSYGGPRALQSLIDAAHAHGLAVILDVVYNHLGPEGNYLGEFGPYFTDRYGTPWGQALNYDGADSDAVRRFVIDNACMWVRDFHVDGLRLDAVHSIFDMGAKHLLAELQEEVQTIARAAQRHVHVIAESDQNDVRVVRARELGGYDLDGVWSDDFHHSVHALLTGERTGYYEDYGQAEHLARAFSDVFVYNGRYSPFRRRTYGSSTHGVARNRFVVCVQNHDQVGNRAVGDRLSATLSPAAQRLAATLLLMHPGTPLLFMGEEYGEKRPFPYFCSFPDPQLAEAVRAGRRAEFAAFGWQGELPDPQAEETFESAKLSWEWSEESVGHGLRQLYRDLLAARRRWPALQERQVGRAEIYRGRETIDDGGPATLVVELGRAGELVMVANLSAVAQTIQTWDRTPAVCLLSSEATRYGGGVLYDELPAVLDPFECRVFGPGGYRQ